MDFEEGYRSRSSARRMAPAWMLFVIGLGGVLIGALLVYVVVTGGGAPTRGG